VRSGALAEELVQEVFLSLWRGRVDWVVRTSVRGWLYAAVRHRALNHIRHARVDRRLRERVDAAVRTSPVGDPTHCDEAQVAMGTPPTDAQVAVEIRELDEALAHAISGLSEGRRIAMTLRWKHELSAAEIAQVLGTTPESVRVLLSRARRDLAVLLERFRD